MEPPSVVVDCRQTISKQSDKQTLSIYELTRVADSGTKSASPSSLLFFSSLASRALWALRAAPLSGFGGASGSAGAERFLLPFAFGIMDERKWLEKDCSKRSVFVWEVWGDDGEENLRGWMESVGRKRGNVPDEEGRMVNCQAIVEET